MPHDIGLLLLFAGIAFLGSLVYGITGFARDHKEAAELQQLYSTFAGNTRQALVLSAQAAASLFGLPAPRLGGGTACYLGEIVGQYDLFNTNENVHQIGITLNPSFHVLDKGDSTKFDILYYHFMLDQPGAVGATSSNYADELDLVTEYQYNTPTYIAIAGGVAVPEAAAQQMSANNGTAAGGRVTGLLEAYVTYAF